MTNFSGLAQAVEPQVIGIAGKSYNSSGGLTISLIGGEPLITTIEKEGSIITQGFLQPFMRPPCQEVDVSFFPNPTDEILNISTTGCELPLERVVVIDLYGKVMDKTVVKESRISLLDVVPGIYLVQVFLQNDVHAGTFKVVKIGK